MRLVLLLGLVFALGVLTPALASRQGDQPAPQRVILRVNRNLEVAGHIALEDADVIAVRDLKGQVVSFAKPRVAQIVRLVDPQPGQTGIVFLLDGETREGVIIEDAFEHVLMEIPPGSGIRAKLKRDLVSHVVLQPSFEQRYQEYKAALQPGMYDAHLALCKWLFEQRRYELAEQELRELLDKTEMADARKLLTIVEAQLALSQPRPKSDESEHEGDENESADGESDTTEEPEKDSSNTSGSRTLTRAEVNLIRVFEIDFDHPPKVTITPETIKALIDNYGTHKQIPASQTGRNAMYRAAANQPLDIVRLMFDLRARDLYDQIRVNTEPHSMNLFRQRVHDTWLMNNCATSRCHGGPEAGRFFLHRKNYKDERVRYTNFLILERLKIDPEWQLINYDKPEDSLILQYALPRNESRKPHPHVPGWTAAINASSKRLHQDAIDWIKSMMSPRPEYPVQFEPVPPSAAQIPAEDGGASRPDR